LQRQAAAVGGASHIIEQEKRMQTTGVALKKVEQMDMITPSWHEQANEIQQRGTVVQDLPMGLSLKSGQSPAMR
jgi:hypothetical protein